jgi:hypothetical protein
MNSEEKLPPIYLRKSDFTEGEILTIKDLVLREFTNPDGSKRITIQVLFEEKNGWYGLNKTTAQALTRAFGDTKKAWIGKKVKATTVSRTFRGYGTKEVLTFEPVSEQKEEKRRK